MRSLMRRGVTLLELLVVLTLLGCLSVASIALVTGVSRAARRATTGLAEQRTVATVGRVLRHELAQAASGEVTLLNATTLGFRRVVGDGPICRSDTATIWIAQVEWRGARLPDPTRDKLELLPVAANSPWLEVGMTRLTTTHCPDGRTAIQLVLDRSIPTPGYLRVYEPVRFSVYRSNGSDWYGLAPGDGSSSVQPFAGPVVPGTDLPQLTSDRLILPGRHPSGSTFSVTIPLAPSLGPPL